jgi:hypothetical protein
MLCILSTSCFYERDVMVREFMWYKILLPTQLEPRLCTAVTWAFVTRILGPPREHDVRPLHPDLHGVWMSIPNNHQSSVKCIQNRVFLPAPITINLADDHTSFQCHLCQAYMLMIIQNAVLPSQSQSRPEASL